MSLFSGRKSFSATEQSVHRVSVETYARSLLALDSRSPIQKHTSLHICPDIVSLWLAVGAHAVVEFDTHTELELLILPRSASGQANRGRF